MRKRGTPLAVRIQRLERFLRELKKLETTNGSATLEFDGKSFMVMRVGRGLCTVTIQKFFPGAVRDSAAQATGYLRAMEKCWKAKGRRPK